VTRASATGSSSSAPIAVCPSTSTSAAGLSSPTATLISRYGMLQMTLIAAKSTRPRRVTVGKGLSPTAQ
jgi:hypothetical protein